MGKSGWDALDVLVNRIAVFVVHASVVWGIPNSYVIRYIINTYLKRHRLGVD